MFAIDLEVSNEQNALIIFPWILLVLSQFH
jgi:hypothetical protein